MLYRKDIARQAENEPEVLKTRVMERDGEFAKLVLDRDDETHLYSVFVEYPGGAHVLTQTKTLLLAEHNYQRHLDDMRAKGWRLETNLDRADYCPVTNRNLTPGEWGREGDKLQWAADAIAAGDAKDCMNWLGRFGTPGAYDHWDDDNRDAYLFVAHEVAKDVIEENDPLFDEKGAMRRLWVEREREATAKKIAQAVSDRLAERVPSAPEYWH